MINNFHFFHGVAISRIIHFDDKIMSLNTYPTKSNSSYVINNNIGVYIKYSEKRMSPWRFSFLKEHQDEIYDMNKRMKKMFIIFICNTDGIACLSFEELKKILDNEHKSIEWVAISRKKREKYVLTGTDGKLGYRIGDSDFPKKLFSKKHNNILIDIFR